MRDLLFLAAVAAGLYFGWQKFSEKSALTNPTGANADKAPAANMGNRIDNLSGAAPQHQPQKGS